MNDTVVQPRVSLFWRVMRTPLRRLVRGKIGPGRTVDDAVALLPGGPARTVREVVKRSRLWRNEKVSVAEELAAHFLDGVEAGATEADLVRDFGDPATAAKLIRRAKKRNRPIVWHISRWMVRTLAALVLIYVGLGVYYVMGEPKPTVDYAAQLTASIKAIPDQDRAWPVYRTALLKIEELPDLATEPRRGMEALRQVEPGDENWPALSDYVSRQEEAIALIRRGAAEPALGFVFGEWEKADAALWPELRSVRSTGDVWEGAMSGILLPHLSKMREMSILLTLDMHRAADAGEADTIVADVTAMLGVARHSADAPFLINQMVGLAILQDALAEVDRLLAHYPRLLSDEQLVSLAHALATTEELLEVDLLGERQMFYDVIQRTFTPGDNGHLAYAGLQSLNQGALPVRGGDPAKALTITGYPAAVMAVASRGEIVREYDRLMDEYQIRIHESMWKWATDDAGDDLDEKPFMDRLRYAPVVLLLPALHRVGLAVEWARAERDATQVALALELHRRRHSEYPSSLEQLVPGLLPRVPADRFTGQSVRYRVVDGAPLIYSVGVDRDDDGGRAVPHEAGKADPAREWMAVEYLPPASEAQRVARIDGDWILYDPAGASKPTHDDEEFGPLAP